MPRTAQCPPPQLDGYFTSVRNRNSFLRVEGGQVSHHEAGREVFSAMRMEYGEFGVAPDQMSQVSGINNLNIKLLVFFDQKNPAHSNIRIKKYNCIGKPSKYFYFFQGQK